MKNKYVTIDELRLIDNIFILLEKKVVLYGAGYQGVQTCKKLIEADMPAAYFCDGDPRKWGTYVESTKVLSLNELKKLDESEDIAIIIASNQVSIIDQIIGDIAWLELRTDNIFTMFALTVSLVWNKRACLLNGGNYTILQEMYRDIFRASEGVRHFEMFASWAKRTDLILVYSIPKSGSSTICGSLLKAYVPANHLHFLTEHSEPAMERIMERRRHDYLKILKSRESVKIINVMREPISRKLSHLFHMIGNHEFALGKLPPDECVIDSFSKLVSSQNGEIIAHKWETFDWYDAEIKPVFGVDIYDYPFDKSKGYAVIKQDNIEILLVTLEKLNSLEQVIAEFVGVPRFKLESDNIGDNKPYKYMYKQVKNLIKIPQNIIDFYYKDPRMNHFYTEEEISCFLDKWKRNITD